MRGLALLLLAAAALADEQGRQPPGAAALLELAPVLSHEDPESGPFTLEIRLPRYAPLCVRLCRASPASCSLAAYLLDDGCPVLAACDGRTLVYDLASDAVLLLPGTCGTLRFGLEGENLEFQFGWIQGPATGSRCRFAVDLLSLARRTENPRAEPAGEGRFRLAGRSPSDHTVAAIVDPLRAPHLERLVLAIRDPAPARIEVTLEAGPASPLTLPSTAKLAGRLGVLRQLDPGSGDLQQVQATVNRALLVLAATIDPSWRTAAEEQLERLPDWKLLEERHRRLRPVLVELLGSGPVTGGLRRGREAALGREFEEAAREWAVAARSGDVEAQQALASLFASGQGVPADGARAIGWLRRSAEGEHPPAQHRLGCCYAAGEFVERDLERAVLWFRRAVDHDHAPSQFALGSLILQGPSGETRLEEALSLFRLAARQGHAEAQHFLGLSRLRGVGSRRDAFAAAEWFRKAAEQGHAESRLELGKLLETGEGVERDEGRAARWFESAAEQGLAEAQYRIGAARFYGRGVGQDEVIAKRWLSRAALQGHAPAQGLLGVLLARAERSGPLALAWLTLAVEGGCEQVAAVRARLEGTLEEDAAEEAARLLADLRRRLPER